MIDTDKYEGHPPAPWGWRHKVSEYRLTANGDKDWIDIQVDEDTDPTVMTLIADAPLLLEEVKRLREAFVIAVRHVGYHHSQDDLWYALRKRGMDDLYDDDEDFGEWEE